jgi:DNA-binding beta-propeller fold protein YncE
MRTIALLLAAASCFAADAPASTDRAASGRIYFLDLRGHRIVSANPDGSDIKVLRDDLKEGPDGVVVDSASRHIFWSNMGKVKLDDGSIMRADLDGSNLTTIVPVGGTFTAKQMKLDAKHGKLYWSDREGMRVMRSNIDGSHIETLIESGHGDEDRKDARNWCVGIAVDAEKGKIYWTQKGGDNANQGTLRRANLDGKHAEILFDNLPEPIDIDLDMTHRMIYWTDRGDPPKGNTVNRAPMDKKVAEPEIVMTGLKEGIGIALDVPHGRMFVTDLGGNVYSANLDGSDKKMILTGQGSLTGITYAESK